MTRNILRVDSSASGVGSTTNTLSTELVDGLRSDGDTVVTRDVSIDTPLLTPEVTAFFRNRDADRAGLSSEALELVELSDTLIAELKAADVVVVGAPIYNFGVPASLKAWADLVARAGETFAYTPEGPVGLLIDRPTYIVTSSGGLPVGSPLDHATTWLRGFLGFIGFSSVETIAAEGVSKDPEAAMAQGRSSIAASLVG